MAHGHSRLPNQGRSADIRTFDRVVQVGIPTEGQTLYVDPKAKSDYQVIGIHYFIGGGSCNVTFFVDAVAIITNESDGDGLDGVTASPVDAVPTAYTPVANGQALSVVVTGVSSPVQLVVQFELRRLPVNLDRGLEQHFVKVGPSIDTYIDSESPTPVFGDAVTLNLHQSTPGERHILMEFDLSEYAGSTILSAILHMVPETEPAENHTFEIRRLIESTLGVLTEDETTWGEIVTGMAWPGGAGGLGDTDDTTPTPVVLPVVPLGIAVDTDYLFADLTAFAIDAADLWGSQLLLHITQNGNTAEDLIFHSKENASGALWEPKLWLVHEH